MIEKAILVGIGIVCGAILGFWLGRLSAKYYVGEENDEFQGKAGENMEMTEEISLHEAKERHPDLAVRDTARRVGQNRLWYEKRMLGEEGVCTIGSPVSGVVTDYREGRRPEIILYPMEEKLFAPSGGKVIKLFPLGNEIMFRTEEGTVLRMTVGDGADELHSEYFRPKAIQNEVVNKGKLLLEFDKNSLEAEGIECNISIRVEETGIGEKVLNIAEGRVKVGEGIFEISRM